MLEQSELCADENFRNAFKKSVRERIRLKSTKPKFFLDMKKVEFVDKSGHNYGGSVILSDIQKMLIHLARPTHNLPPRWCRVLRKDQIPFVFVVIVNDINWPDLVQCGNGQTVEQAFSPVIKLFASSFGGGKVEFKRSSGKDLLSELVSTPTTIVSWMQDRNSVDLDKLVDNVRKYASKTVNGCLDNMKPTTVSRVDKMDLMLSVNQMLRGGFPFPGFKDTTDYSQLRAAYTPVTNNSPMFAIDCEMVVTSDQRQQAGWIAVVDEKLRVVYETLIKPEGTVVDYVTRVSLEEVKQALEKVLPSDAILIGHNMVGDLNSLRLFYPYIIDTSCIFNLDGFRANSPSLKKLAAKYLGVVIQLEDRHHNPVEDARASMQLVQYKLRNGLMAGDAVLNGVSAEDELLSVVCNMKDRETLKAFLYNTGVGFYNDIFLLLKETKKVLLIDRKADSPSKHVSYQYQRSNRQTMLAAQSAINAFNRKAGEVHDMVLCQFYVRQLSMKKIRKLSRYLRRLFDDLTENSFMSLMFASKEHDSGTIMCTTKCEEVLKPLIVNGITLPHDFRLNEENENQMQT